MHSVQPPECVSNASESRLIYSALDIIQLPFSRELIKTPHKSLIRVRYRCVLEGHGLGKTKAFLLSFSFQYHVLFYRNIGI